MKLTSKPKFFTGIIILIILIISYFIKINVEIGANYKTLDTLLGAIIFHNPIILLIYIIISLALILLAFKKLKII